MKGRALRITHKIPKPLQITKLQISRASIFCYSFPFSTVSYHPVLLFLATYWPLGKINALRVTIVNVGIVKFVGGAAGIRTPGLRIANRTPGKPLSICLF